MDKEILEILKSLQEDTKEIKSALKEIDRKLDGVVEQTADLTEFRTSVISRLDELKEVEEVTKANCYEIAKLKIIK
ncbi:MAG: hypothetical protein E6X12_10670 [Actinomyces sp.]|jgi:tetrahydromethanopterin S-methyltransferase subunit G|uniref:plasmid stabilization protein n=1 Tax=Clostridium cadaveris TaxID=1529 RepID=UPI001E3FDAB4|nr:plasmid stabilization protein [Clostridium cadaveris]MDM8313573.1 plasmid stabilization protein [Clostridium cadaveris]MDU5006916.1 hypothetical protein [Actinomyces sp.]UFH66753.1 plasmid stabilization protein [Clostridium cadaveris]